MLGRGASTAKVPTTSGGRKFERTKPIVLAEETIKMSRILLPAVNRNLVHRN